MFHSLHCWEELLDIGGRARDDVHGDDLPSSRCGGARIGGSLDRADVPAHHHGDETRADLLAADELDVRRLDHRVGGLDRPHESLGFDQPQRLCAVILVSQGQLGRCTVQFGSATRSSRYEHTQPHPRRAGSGRCYVGLVSGGEEADGSHD